jgi:hypothetical protein
MQTSEREVRRALRHRADGFEMPPEPPERIADAIGRRRTRNGVLAGLAATGIAAIVAASIVATQLPRSGSPGGQVADGGSVSYVLLGTTATTGQTAAPSWLTDHIACMRAQGFDIPDPTETPDGWSIVVDDPEAFGFGTPAWREAAFVTCAIDRPLSGNLILGLSKDRVDAFVACMTGQGYDLPVPTTNDQGEYVFDLTETDIDTGQASWDRAAFVTCSPDRASER